MEENKLTSKERLAIPVQAMPEQDAKERIHNVQEVPRGYTDEQAMTEATRCLQCKKAPCVQGCPVEINIPGFLNAIVQGDFRAGIDIIKETNILPAVCGRVCPQEEQCQAYCIVGKSLKSTDLAVQIGKLERFLADWEREKSETKMPEIKPPTGQEGRDRRLRPCRPYRCR